MTESDLTTRGTATATGAESSDSPKGSVKSLAIRLQPDIHAQLSLIAQLRGSTITDEIRQAIDGHVTSVRSTPDFAAQAEHVLAEIDRQATARRDAIATLFGTQPNGPATDTANGSTSSKGSTAAASRGRSAKPSS